MVVDPQGDASLKALEARRKHTGGSHVHADNGIPGFGGFLGQTHMEPPEPVGYLRIFQNMGGFSQFPQSPAQCRAAAQGVPVRTAMGQDGIMVMGNQKGGGLSLSQFLHRALPPES